FDPVPKPPDLPRRGYSPQPVPGPSSGPQPRWDLDDRRGREHLRADGGLLNPATRQHRRTPEAVIVGYPDYDPRLEDGGTISSSPSDGAKETPPWPSAVASDVTPPGRRTASVF